jgi:5-methylcytosine-specific restriction endonuclease McrA
MYSSILDKPLVLALNSAWQAIGHRTVRQAIVALSGGERGSAPAVGLDISYSRAEDGSWEFENPVGFNPVPWEDWFNLPIRDFDLTISSAKQLVRVPTVIIAVNYSKMPVARPRLSREAIFQRDQGICQFTGEYVGLEGGNLDHIVPRSRGGKDSFENLVWSKREVNTAKGNKMPHEAGLRLIRPPAAPKGVPVSATIKEARHPDWRHFIRR